MRLDILSNVESKIDAQLEGSGPLAGWAPGEGDEAWPSLLGGTYGTALGPVPSGVAPAVLASGHPVWGRAEKRAKWVGGTWVCPGGSLPMLSPVSSLQCLPGWILLSMACLEQRAPRATPGNIPGDWEWGVQASILQKSRLTLLSGGSPWLIGQELTLMILAHIHGHPWF